MMLWPIVALVCIAALAIMLVLGAYDGDWVEWRHPPQNDDGITEDDEHDQSD